MKYAANKKYTPFGKRLLSFDSCDQCELANTKYCKSIVHGLGNINTKVMFVGEGPGQTEDDTALPFIGKSGQFLRSEIESIFHLNHNDFFYTNVVRCRVKNNYAPEKHQTAACFNYLLHEVGIIKPLIIITLGNSSSKTLLGSKFSSISKNRLKTYASDICQYIIPVSHPASVMYGSEAEVIGKRAKFKVELKFAKDIYNDHKNDDKSEINIQHESSFDF